MQSFLALILVQSCLLSTLAAWWNGKENSLSWNFFQQRRGKKNIFNSTSSQSRSLHNHKNLCANTAPRAEWKQAVRAAMVHASSNSKKLLAQQGSDHVLWSYCRQWGQRAGHCTGLLRPEYTYSSRGDERASGSARLATDYRRSLAGYMLTFWTVEFTLNECHAKYIQSNGNYTVN